MAIGIIREVSLEEAAFVLRLKEWRKFPPFELRGRETLRQRQLQWAPCQGDAQLPDSVRVTH